MNWFPWFKQTAENTTLHQDLKNPYKQARLYEQGASKKCTRASRLRWLVLIGFTGLSSMSHAVILTTQGGCAVIEDHHAGGGTNPPTALVSVASLYLSEDTRFCQTTDSDIALTYIGLTSSGPNIATLDRGINGARIYNNLNDDGAVTYPLPYQDVFLYLPSDSTDITIRNAPGTINASLSLTYASAGSVPVSFKTDNKLFSFTLEKNANSYAIEPFTISVAAVVADTAGPAFTSGATASFQENGTGTAYTAVATDDTAPVTFTLTGGADQSLFSLTSAGVLKFDASPDFESAGDVGGNNVYNIEITATDSASPANTAIQIVEVTVTNDTSDDAAGGGGNGLGTAYATETFSAGGWNGDIPTGWTATTLHTPASYEGSKVLALNPFSAAFRGKAHLPLGTAQNGTYVFSVDAGSWNGYAKLDIASVFASVGLYTGGTTAASPGTAVSNVTASMADPAQGGWATWTFTVQGSDIGIGQPFGFYLDVPEQLPAPGASGFLSIDNAKLLFTAVADTTGSVFTSGATASFQENGTGTVYTAVATDDTAPVTFTLTGGADQNLFSLTSAGVLKFDASPDFENSGAASGNNVYSVEITATDSALPANTTVQIVEITVTNDTSDDPVATPSETLTLSPMLGMIDPDAATQTLTFTLHNSTAAVLGLIDPTVSGSHPSEFSLGTSPTNPCGATLASAASCQIQVDYSKDSAVSGSRNVLLKVLDDQGGIIAQSLLTSNESVANATARRIPDILESVRISPSLQVGVTSRVTWTQLGYQAQVFGQVAMFECALDGTAAVQTCGDNYSNRTYSSIALPADSTVDGSVEYDGQVAKLRSFYLDYTPTQAGPVVFRFYQKSVQDNAVGNASISLLAPGDLKDLNTSTALQYFDLNGRRLLMEVAP